MKFIQTETYTVVPILINLDKVSSITRDKNGRAVVCFVDDDDFVTLNCLYEHFIQTIAGMKEVTIYGV